jgi:hypothetical protein
MRHEIQRYRKRDGAIGSGGAEAVCESASDSAALLQREVNTMTDKQIKNMLNDEVNGIVCGSRTEILGECGVKTKEKKEIGKTVFKVIGVAASVLFIAALAYVCYLPIYMQQHGLTPGRQPNDITDAVYTGDEFSYGQFNGYSVRFERGMSCVESRIDVAGYTFRYTSSFSIIAEKNGAKCTLEDAFKNGYLAEEDIAEINRIHRQNFESSYGNDDLDKDVRYQAGVEEIMNNTSDKAMQKRLIKELYRDIYGDGTDDTPTENDLLYQAGIEEIKSRTSNKAEQKRLAKELFKAVYGEGEDPYEYPELPDKYDLSGKDLSSVVYIEISVDYTQYRSIVADSEIIKEIIDRVKGISCYDTGLESAYYSGTKFRVTMRNFQGEEVFRFLINQDGSFSCTDYYSRLFDGTGISLAVYSVTEESDLTGLTDLLSDIVYPKQAGEKLTLDAVQQIIASSKSFEKVRKKTAEIGEFVRFYASGNLHTVYTLYSGQEAVGYLNVSDFDVSYTIGQVTHILCRYGDFASDHERDMNPPNGNEYDYGEYNGYRVKLVLSHLSVINDIEDGGY